MLASLLRDSILSPNLFNIYSSDIPGPKDIFLVHFAGDIVHLTRFKNSNISIHKTRKTLCNIFYKDWHTDIITRKNKVVLFTRKITVVPISLLVFNPEISLADEAKYLDKRLHFVKHK